MKDNIVKADYEMVFSLDEIVAMADDNVSYGGGRFAKKWLDEIENNSTDFVHFIAQAIDEYDKSVDIDKQIAITDDDMNTMYAWRENNWVFDGVLENYPKMTRDEEGKIPYTVKGDSVIVKMSVGIDVDMLKYSLENARANEIIKRSTENLMQTFDKKDMNMPKNDVKNKDNIKKD